MNETGPIKIMNRQNAEHYTWGNASHGWHFLKREDLSIIHEEVPPGDSEIRHFHSAARQFFFILSGTASIEIGGETVVLHANEGVEIAPGTPHQFTNRSNETVRMIVVSMPHSHGDRTAVP